jgi:selenocysteine lyase/cysteine desulfurase
MDKKAVRELFPVTRHLVYFNHAAVGPLSTRAAEAMEAHVRDQRDHGALHWREWYAEDAKLRASAAKMIGADAGEIAILKNTSEGLSFVAEGFRWKSGENAVVTAMEFPSNYSPWMALKRRGVESRVAKSATVDEIEPLIDGRTRIVSVSSVAFHNGFTADLDAIGDLCASRNVLLCVDAIQSLGVLPIDVRRSKIAFLAADSHKWMCGPEGAAIFYAAAEHRDRLEVLETGWTNVSRQGSFLEVPPDLKSDARRFEAGTLNTNGVYGARAAYDLLLEIGIDNLAAEVRRLAGSLADKLESIGWRVGSPRPVASGIVGAIPPGVEPSLLRWHRTLEENGVVCAPREGMLRFAPHFYNDDAEIDRVIEVLRYH